MALIISMNAISQEKIELPSFDDFEETISNDAIFTKWTTENLEGWHYWHIIPGGGNPRQCMRFENTDLNQNDWLISKPVNCSAAENLKVNFSHLFHANRVPPKLYYTNQYNGNASQSSWKELSYSFGENENQWYASEDFIIEKPGDVIYFAFHYLAAANAGAYFLLDNFSVKEYIPVAPFELVGSTEHFEFYSRQSNDTNYHYLSGICDDLVKELLSYWERPLFENLLEDRKIKFYISNRTDLEAYSGSNLPDWKCGSYKLNEKSVAVALPETAEQINFYESFYKLVKGTIGQLILAIRFNRQWELNNPPNFFMEGFGLYFSGQRPGKQNIINLYNNLGRYPELSDMEEVPLVNYGKQYFKDLITSYIQYVKLADRAYHYMTPYEDIPEWHAHWKHYYLNNEEERIQLYYSSENFDIYCTTQDAGDAPAFAEKCEEKFTDYKKYFKVEVPHRFDVVVYPNAEVGTECFGSQHNGGHGVGGDKFDIISPRTLWGGPDNPDEPIKEALDFMIPHEFLHIYHNHFWPFYTIMGRFYIEGLANFMAGYGSEGYLEIDTDDPNLWKIDEAFANYRYNQNREPDLDDLSDHTVNDAYYFGEHYFNYLIKSGITFTQIRDWFIGNANWSVYPISYKAIDDGYVKYLKQYAHLLPKTSPLTLPFIDEFNDFSYGWGRFNETSLDNWTIKDFDDNIYARFYNYTENINNNQAWLISPLLDATGLEQVYISFDTQFRENISIDVFYTEEYHDPLNEADWIPIEEFNITTSWDWQNTGKVLMENPPKHFHVGIRYSSSGEIHQSCAIDNFSVKASITGIDNIKHSDEILKVYPNPMNNKSYVSFTNRKPGNVLVEIFDINGCKLISLVNENLAQGTYSYEFDRKDLSAGLYIVSLSTPLNQSNIKLIVND